MGQNRSILRFHWSIAGVSVAPFFCTGQDLNLSSRPSWHTSPTRDQRPAGVAPCAASGAEPWQHGASGSTLAQTGHGHARDGCLTGRFLRKSPSGWLEKLGPKLIVVRPTMQEKNYPGYVKSRSCVASEKFCLLLQGETQGLSSPTDSWRST